MDIDLKRIAEQARHLAESASALRSLRARQLDKGQRPPTQEDLERATRAMQAAFLAVIRVTAEYL